MLEDNVRLYFSNQCQNSCNYNRIYDDVCSNCNNNKYFDNSNKLECKQNCNYQCDKIHLNRFFSSLNIPSINVKALSKNEIENSKIIEDQKSDDLNLYKSSDLLIKEVMDLSMIHNLKTINIDKLGREDLIELSNSSSKRSLSHNILFNLKNDNSKKFSKSNLPNTIEKDESLITSNNLTSNEETFKKLISIRFKNVEENNLNYFLMNPIPKNFTLICNIKKENFKLKEKIYPRYILYINSNDKFLLAAKKIFKPMSSTYLISKNKEIINQKSSDYIGKVSSNFIGNEFNIFGRGKKANKLNKNFTELRPQYGAVIYDMNILGLKGPRKMSVYLSGINNQETISFKPTSDKLYLQNLKNYSNILCDLYINKPPIWDEMYKTYGLKFNSRVEKSSTKNFQLIKVNGEEILLQFGKINDNLFSMDFQHPLSPFQAFAICLTSLASKRACE